MRKTFMFVQGLSVALLMTGCKPPESRVPEPRAPEAGGTSVDKIVQNLLICRKAGPWPDLPAGAVEGPAVRVEDEVGEQKYEWVDCDGRVRGEGTAPVRSVSKTVSLPPVSDLRGPVHFVEVANPNTCVNFRIQAVEDSQLVRPVALPSGQTVLADFPLSQAGRSGHVELKVTDSKLKSRTALNLLEGKNRVEVSYWGRCLRYRAKPDREAGDAVNCERAELLARQFLVVDLEVRRPVLGGVQPRSVCSSQRSQQ